jgi:hypothetical protein
MHIIWIGYTLVIGQLASFWLTLWPVVHCMLYFSITSPHFGVTKGSKITTRSNRMKTNLIKISGLAVALMCSAVMAETALAQGPGPGRSPVAPNQGAQATQGHLMQRGKMMRGQMGGMDESLVAITANVVGMPQADLVAALKSGKTIADVAKEKNVDPAKVVEAFVAEKVADRQAMVASGRWTQAQLDTMTAMMKANITQKLSQPFTVQGTGTGWVDADGDGKCDNMPMKRRGPSQNT